MGEGGYSTMEMSESESESCSDSVPSSLPLSGSGMMCSGAGATSSSLGTTLKNGLVPVGVVGWVEASMLVFSII